MLTLTLIIKQLFCLHKNELTRRDAETGRMWTECHDCGKESAGIVMGVAPHGGAFEYNRQRGNNPGAWVRN